MFSKFVRALAGKTAQFRINATTLLHVFEERAKSSNKRPLKMEGALLLSYSTGASVLSQVNINELTTLL